MQSMTGFSSGNFSFEGATYTYYIRGVNHRYLDLSIRIPSQLDILEEEISKRIKQWVGRGRVDFSLRLEQGSSGGTFGIDNDKLQTCMSQLQDIAQTYGIDQKVSLGDIIRIPKIFEAGSSLNIDDFKSVFFQELEFGLQRFITARTEEGKALQQDLSSQVHKILTEVSWVEQHQKDLESTFRNQITQRYQELMESSITPEKLASEIAFLLMRYGINEEIVRLQAHCKSFLERLPISIEAPVHAKGTQPRPQPKPIILLGKELEFLVKEMHREVNTIGSKSSHVELSNRVILMKGAVEDMREQLRNVQ